MKNVRVSARPGTRAALAVAVAVSATAAFASASCGGGERSYPADVWAVVDGRPISKADVEKAYRAVVQPTSTPPSDEERLTAELGVLDELITQDILMARAKATGLSVTPAEIDAAFAERRGGMTEETMALQLAQRGMTTDDVRSVLERELLVQKLLDRDVADKATVTDAEIEAFFEQNRSRFNLTEAQYRIAQIVVTPRRDAQVANRMNDDAGTPQAAEQKVAMLFEKMKSGADFGELAADYSEDPQSAPQGGDLGFIPESSLKQAPAALRELVLKMEPGNVNTVTVNGAYTIVLLIAREPAGQRDLSAPNVRDTIRDGLRERKDRLLRTAYLAAARTGATIDHRIAKQVVAGGVGVAAGAGAGAGAGK